MRALKLADPKTNPPLLVDAPEPTITDNEVLVRVHATAVTPTEIRWQPVKAGQIPSHEFSGVIEQAGDDVSGVRVGDKVFGMNGWTQDGAMAELVVTRKEWMAVKPESLRHTDAAMVPISALTAWQALVERADVQRGETVLVHGGAGAVGLFAIQIARRLGAKVMTTASADQASFLRELGAEQVIDYKREHFEKMLRDVDVVFDTVGGETLRRSWDVLARDGRLVTIAADAENMTDERVKKAFLLVEPKREQLERIAMLLSSGELRTVVDSVIPLEDAAKAYMGEIAKKTGRGKIVVNLDM